jgi:predicted DCC family thiol-disulfide oxidoreductase YuxK
MTTGGRTVVLYDGDCGLCHGFVQWLLARDRRDALRFAPIQGPWAARFLPKHGKSQTQLDTVFVVQGDGSPEERVLERSDAAIAAVVSLGGLWRAAAVLKVFPRFLRDAVYDWVARNRTRWFGKSACQIPSRAERAKFLET